MKFHPQKRVALVFDTRINENISILNSISKFNRFNLKWTAFLDDLALAKKNPRWLLTHSKWDGIIAKTTSPELLEACVAKSIPIVDLSNNPYSYPGIPKIRPDNRAIGHVGAEHFLDRDFRQFAFCSYSNETWAQERKNGFTEALRFAGLDCSIYESNCPTTPNPQWEVEELQYIGKWLNELPKPIAIMGCDDTRALQIATACRFNNILVPYEIAILGVNNESLYCEASIPPLSSIPINTELYGQKAAETITKLIYKIPVHEEDFFVEPLDVVSRRSTDITSVEDPYVSMALKIIQTYIHQNVKVHQIVKRMNTSRSQLERRFRKILGNSPKSEILAYQIQTVKKLLKQSNHSLSHIAELSGFEHPEYLSVFFKKNVNMTPNQYRKSTSSMKLQNGEI